jgi:hypothetical protein
VTLAKPVGVTVVRMVDRMVDALLVVWLDRIGGADLDAEGRTDMADVELDCRRGSATLGRGRDPLAVVARATELLLLTVMVRVQLRTEVMVVVPVHLVAVMVLRITVGCRTEVAPVARVGGREIVGTTPSEGVRAAVVVTVPLTELPTWGVARITGSRPNTLKTLRRPILYSVRACLCNDSTGLWQNTAGCGRCGLPIFQEGARSRRIGM